MYDYKVILVGCTKNSGSYIHGHLTRLNQMSKFFTKFNIVLYENDSTDNTIEQLNLFKSNNSNFDFISETNVVEKYIQNKHINLRVQIISHGRNCLLYIINSLYTNYDYMIMIDLDTVLNNFDPNNIQNIFSYDTNLWDVLTANCNGPYYDIWALRISQNIWQDNIHGKIWSNPIIHDCWAQHVMNMSFKDCVKSYQKVIPMNSPLIETDSSFGGAGIYRINKIKDCYYNPFFYNHHMMIVGHCEHVSFHKDIKKNGGRIFICPSFLVNCPIEHIQK
jgi:hypothetical protein